MNEKPPTVTAPARVVLATLMRPRGTSGVQTHVRTVEDHLRAVARPLALVTPFSAHSAALVPVFAARRPLRRLSPAAGVWWYRHWHAVFLQRSLSAQLAKPGPTVVYAQCPVSAAAALRIRRDQPVVMAVHFNLSQADEWAEQEQLPRDGRLCTSIREFEARTLPRLDGLVYVSEFSRRRTEERIPAARAVPSAVVHNAVHARAPAARSTAAPTRDLITVGSLEPRKNQTYLLEILAAAARLGHRYTLTVVGEGPDRRRLEAAVNRLGLGAQVELLGRHPDPRSLMSAHRLYCHTATMESFGIVLLEAMVEGLPVLACPVGGVPEVVRAGHDGALWPLDDADAAARMLIDLLDDPAGLAEMGLRAAERAAAEFGVAALGGKLLALLDGVHRRGG